MNMYLPFKVDGWYGAYADARETFVKVKVEKEDVKVRTADTFTALKEKDALDTDRDSIFKADALQKKGGKHATPFGIGWSSFFSLSQEDFIRGKKKPHPGA